MTMTKAEALALAIGVLRSAHASNTTEAADVLAGEEDVVDYSDTSADHEHDWMVTEDGYSRSWSTSIDDESKVITATYDGSSDFSESGDGEYLFCTQCAARADIPEGYEVDWS